MCIANKLTYIQIIGLFYIYQKSCTSRIVYWEEGGWVWDLSELFCYLLKQTMIVWSEDFRPKVLKGSRKNKKGEGGKGPAIKIFFFFYFLFKTPIKLEGGGGKALMALPLRK